MTAEVALSNDASPIKEIRQKNNNKKPNNRGTHFHEPHLIKLLHLHLEQMLIKKKITKTPLSLFLGTTIYMLKMSSFF